MPIRPLVLDAFAHLHGLVEVVGYGKARRPSGDAAEVEIQVFLARPDPANGYMFAKDERPVSCWIGCGQLGLVPIGSRWQSGLAVGERRAQSGTSKVRFRKKEVIGDCVDDPELKFFPVYGQEHARCYLMTLGDPTENKVGLVPVMEVIRALFGVSSGFLRPLFDGVRDPAVTRDRIYVDRSKSGWLGGRTFSLWCSRKPTQEETLISALVLTDDGIRLAHDAVFSALSANRRWREQGSAFVDMPYPFTSPNLWKFESRWVAVKGQKGEVVRRLLITRILALGLPAKFEIVERSYPGSGTVEELPRPQGRSQVTNANVLRLQTSRAPGAGRLPVNVTTAGATFEDTASVEIVDRPRDSSARAEQSDLRRDFEREEIAASTGDRRSGGGSDVVHVAIGRRERVSSGEKSGALDQRLASLKRTHEAVTWLSKKNNWPITIGRGSPGNLPLVKVSGDGWEGDLLLMVLKTEQGCVVVADMGSIEGDPRALGLLASKTQAEIDWPAVRAIVGYVTQECGRWLRRERKLEGYEIKAVRRPEDVWHNNEHYGRLIERGVSSLFSRLPS